MDTLTQGLYDAVIIGAGPAGMMAAITAAKGGRRVLLLEKMPDAGRKLLISGKGRCNLTNAGSVDKFLEKFSASGVFLRNAFAKFFNNELCRFFEQAGCPLKTERGERIFPASEDSQDILNVLKKLLKQNKVELKYDEPVKDVSLREDAIKRVLTKSSEPRPFGVSSRALNDPKGRGEYFAPKVAICTGGLSYPGTGSTGFGLDLAKKFGHSIIAPKPGLVGLITKSDMPGRISGLSLENIRASIICDKKVIESRFGDMLFTHFGLSGPIILDLSAAVYDLLAAGKTVFVSINLKPALDVKKLDGRLVREFLIQPGVALKNIFTELLPRRLAEEFLEYCGCDTAKKANQVTKQERKTFVDRLFDFRFQIIRTRSIKDAIITRGGVATKEINPKTMESRIVKGLYFAGEVIDVDAKTGGYNMQAAFSTGFICGENL